MKMDLSKKEKTKLWLSRISGIILCACLISFLVLYYLNYIDANMLLVSILGLSSLVFVFAAIFLNIKSSRTLTYFIFALAIIFAICFIVSLCYFLENGIFQL